MKDIRLSLGFWDHWKTITLEAELGFEAVKSLQILWCFAAQNKSSGVLYGMPKKAIAIAARFTGDRDAFVDALVDLNFLEFDGVVYTLHDWEEHNGFAATSEQRSEAARKAANAKWEKKRGIKNENTESNADSCTSHCASHKSADAERNAERNPPSPSPSPSPSLKEEKHIVGQERPTPCADGQEIAEKPDPVPYAKIIGALNAACGCQFKADTQATKRHIKARWNEGWRFPDFEAVIRSRRDEWAGDAKMCQFLRPETLFGTKFESYLQQARNGPPGGAASTDGSTAPPNQEELLLKIKEERAERDRKLRGQDAATATP